MKDKIDEKRSNALAFLETALKGRQVNKVLHSFPSPRFWRRSDVPIVDLLAKRRDSYRREPCEFHLYVGVPYCLRTDPGRCGYCLFPVEAFERSGQMDDYLGYLEKEGQKFQAYFEETSPASIYIGGGTPNLFKPHQYSILMDMIRQVFPSLEPNIDMTLEGIPQLFTREKLVAIKEAGFNRISMGVQQMNPELNKLSGRRQTPEHTFQAIAWCQELGLECNADLIYGWPRQNLELMMKDLEVLVATGVPHLTHYELNVGGPTDFALNRRHELPEPSENREMYFAARDYLVSQGYRQLTQYDFEKTPADAKHGIYEECWRDFERRETWGWGFAGVSDFSGDSDDGGWAYVNHRRASDYFTSLDRDEYPIECGFKRTGEDLRLNTLFRNLQSMRVDRKSYKTRYGRDLLVDYQPEWEALAHHGFVEWTDESIILTDEGVYFTPVIQTLLMSSRVEALKEELISHV